MPPSWDEDQAPYDRSSLLAPAVPWTTSAVDNAAQAIAIELAANAAVHRSGRDRSRSDALPSTAKRRAGKATPTSTSDVRGRLGVTADVRPEPPVRARRLIPARSPPAAGTRVCPGTR